MLASSGEITPPCGVPARVALTVPVPPSPRPPATAGSVSAPGGPRSSFHAPAPTFLLVDAVEEAPNVGVQHQVIALIASLADGLQRLRRAPLRTESVTARRKSASKIGSMTDLRRHLHHPVPYRRYAQRPLLPVRLRVCIASSPARTIPACLQRLLDIFQKLASTPVPFDVAERLFVDSRRPAVLPDPFPRFPQDVTPTDPVIQRVEPPCLIPLGARPQLALKFSHFVFGVVGLFPLADQACPRAYPHRHHDQSRVPSLRRFVAAFIGTMDPSDSLFSRTFGFWPYPRGLCLTRLPGRVSPVPYRCYKTCRRLYPGDVQRESGSAAVCCLRRDMSGSAIPNTFRLKM